MLPFADRLLASNVVPGKSQPFITIAIPHYKYRPYLEVVLQTIFVQNYGDFEIVISDDCSPDDAKDVIPALLAQSGCVFRYYLQPQNLGYDGNVRFCLAAGRGRYVMLLGNDDALNGPNILLDLANQLQSLAYPAVAFTNFCDYATGQITNRAQASQQLGTGPTVALRFFRSFSFVSGLIYDRQWAARHETERWDKSIYYQIYLASRIIADGGEVAAVAVCVVRKDVQVAGRGVANYASKWANPGWSFQARHTGLDSVIRVTADAVLPFVARPEQSAALRQIVAQILTITYAHWLFEYRRVANWSFAVGVARDLWPGRRLAEYLVLSRPDRLRLWLLYLAVTIAGLLTPITLFNPLRGRLANLVRRRQQKHA